MVEERVTKKKYKTVVIPSSLFKEIKERIRGTDFDSVSNYITYVLEEIVTAEEGEKAEEIFSKKNEEIVKKRLRELGYL